MTLSAEEFLRRFLSLTLPKGFMKVRHYGFLSSNPKLNIEQIADLILNGFSEFFKNEEEQTSHTSYLRCVKCNSKKVQVVFIPPIRRRFIKNE